MYRTIRVGAADAKSETTAAAVFLFAKTKKLPTGYRQLERRTGSALSQLIRRREFLAEKGTVTVLYPTQGLTRLFVLGLGERARFTADTMRVAAAKLAGMAFAAGLRRVNLFARATLSDALRADDLGRAIGEGLRIGDFSFDSFKGTASEDESGKPRLALTVLVEDQLRAGVARGLKIGESVNTARELAAMPPNVANPSFLVSYCRQLARKVGLKCSVVDAKKAQALGMGGLLAVGAAGSAPPAMIALEHKPPRSRARPVLLVGKAITFDTGGYSLKPRESMTGMKYDKCGGMAVIGALHAVARLRLPVHVVGLIPTAENMVDQQAYRVDDILTLFNGVTVEITNTDAEGRLVLADALSYGCKRYKPAAVIDLATLTGGVVVALGPWCAGAFCADAGLKKRLLDAGEHTGERLWPLPLWDEHKQHMKSAHADIVNAAGRSGHPIQGAAFLAHFVGPGGNPDPQRDLPWAHLDIAGVATTESDTPLYPKGPTGWGVRLLVRTIETWG